MCSNFNILDPLLVDQDDFINNKLSNDDLKTMLSVNLSQINDIKKENNMDVSTNILDEFEYKPMGANAIWKPNYEWSADDANFLDMLLDEPMDSIPEVPLTNMETQEVDTPQLETPTIESMGLLGDPQSQEFNLTNDINEFELYQSNNSSNEEFQLSPVSPLSSSGYGSSSPDKECHSSDDLDSVGSSCGGLSPDGGVTPTYTPESMLNDFFETETTPPPQQKSPTPSQQQEVVSTTSTATTQQQQQKQPIPSPQTTQPKQSLQTRQIQFIRQPKSQIILSSSGRSCASTTASSSSNSNSISTPTVLKTVTVPSGTLSGAPGQTIVVTQGNNRTGTLVRSGTTLLKSGPSSTNATQRSLLLPVNQVKTIKIINNNGLNNRTGLRTVVSTPRTSHNTPTVRTVVGTRSLEAPKGYLKVTPTTLVSSSTLESSKIKEEPFNDDEPINSTRELTLTEEEKKLLKKENIHLPSHYPLTKQEERELKRIRRKIRNKISAQDSRKRKKDYIDGLEDRVKQCKEENHELQKRIKTLETQNESLVAQVRRFQTIMTGGGRIPNQASTCLMVFILSTACIFANLRSQKSTSADESDLSMPAKMPSTGNSRSLLHTGTGAFGMEDDKDNIDVEGPSVCALTDHDYVPPAKRFRSMTSCPNYIIPPLDDLPLKVEKNDPGGGNPPDGSGIPSDKFSKDVDTGGGGGYIRSKNHSDSGDFAIPKIAPSVVVNLRNEGKLLIDDIELE